MTPVTAARPRCDENEDVYVSVNWYPDQFLKVIDLGTEVPPESSVVDLQAGVLRFELPKTARHGAGAASAA